MNFLLHSVFVSDRDCCCEIIQRVQPLASSCTGQSTAGNLSLLFSTAVWQHSNEFFFPMTTFRPISFLILSHILTAVDRSADEPMMRSIQSIVLSSVSVVASPEIK